MASPDSITPSQAARLIGTPAAPVVVDVCLNEDFELDPRLIPGAIRQRHDDIPALLECIGESRAIVYCQKGGKISQGAAALLRCHGIKAAVLAGGQLAWVEHGLPLIPAERIPPRDESGHTRWVTRIRPKIDRIACPWLIRRFIDPGARFLFVSPSEVVAVAERFGATPFDIEGVYWSHRADRCTFDTLLDEWTLETHALRRLASIVRAADTDRHDLAPEAAGLLAISLGLSRMFRDDLEQLEIGMAVYDALYRWARDATEEKHDWPRGH